MTRQIIATLLIFTVMSAIAQPKGKIFFVNNIISDTSTFRNNDDLVGMSPILKSKNGIEIRFITSPSFSNSFYTVLTFNEKWAAHNYYYKPGTNEMVSKDISSKIDIDTLFARLVSNNIFSLPDEDYVKKEKCEYNLETKEYICEDLAISDGECYYIEFKIGDLYRRYGYCNPYDCANYNQQVYEFRNFANIVDVFSECMYK